MQMDMFLCLINLKMLEKYKMANSEWIKLGVIKLGRSGNNYMALGTSKSKYKPVNVRLVVEDLNGKVITSVLNPNLNVSDPRKRPGATEDQVAAIPDFIKAEVSLAPSKE